MPESRVVDSSIAPAILWVIISLLYLASGIHYGLYVLAFAILGWILGLVYGSGYSFRRLGLLSRNGEYKPSRRLAFSWILAIAMSILFIIFMSGFALSIQLPVLTNMTNLATSLAAATYVTQVLLFRHWEKKHGRLIVHDGGWFSTRIHLSPQAVKGHSDDNR